MKPAGRRASAMMLVELLWMIVVAMVVVAILGELLLDGIHLQRVAAQHANHVAVSEGLVKRLRADALGAATHTWGERSPGAILELLTYAAGQPDRVQWVFEPSRVVRREEGRETGVFEAERLGFGARCESGGAAGVLSLDLLVAPPPRAAGRAPRVSTIVVMLPPAGVVERDSDSEAGR